jgi:hypothetical protein
MAISRRKFLYGAVGLGALAVAGGLIYSSLRSPTYLEAFSDPEKRAAWLTRFSRESYSTLRLLSNGDLELLQREGVGINSVAFAATVPRDAAKIGCGSGSTTYVIDTECFRPAGLFQHDLGVIVENVLLRHELIHAEHFHSGISGYDPSWFLKNGVFDARLFVAASEVVAHRSEHKGLAGKMGDFIDYYRWSLPAQVVLHVADALRLATNDRLREKLKQDARF